MPSACQLVDAGVAPHEAEHVDAAGGRQLGEQLADRAVGGVLHDPVARLHVEGVEQGEGAERHREELCGGLIAHSVGHGQEPGRRRDEVLRPDAESAAA